MSDRKEDNAIEKTRDLRTAIPSVDIYENDNEILLYADMPGVKKEYTRSFSVPQSIEVERVEAALKDGVLKLHLPKSEAAKPKMIEINAA